MSSCGWWPVVVLSLLSKNTVVLGSDNAGVTAKPLLPPLLIHCLTWVVTSTLMNCPAVVTGTVGPLPMPLVTGTVFAVTVASAQALKTVCTSTLPGMPMRLTYSSSVALTTLAAVVPAGKVERSKRTRPSDPGATFRLAVLPKLFAGEAVVT